MQPVKDHITPTLSAVKDDSLIRTLFPVDRLVIPIRELVLPKDFSYKLNDILEMCEMIKSGQVNEPIVVNDDLLIVDGKKRYYAFKRLGYIKVTVIKQNTSSNGLNENDFGIIRYDY